MVSLFIMPLTHAPMHPMPRWRPATRRAPSQTRPTSPYAVACAWCVIGHTSDVAVLSTVLFQSLGLVVALQHCCMLNISGDSKVLAEMIQRRSKALCSAVSCFVALFVFFALSFFNRSTQRVGFMLLTKLKLRVLSGCCR